MQNFQDSATSKYWQFEDDVVVTDTNGVYSFTTATGALLNVPTTLQPYTGTWPVLPTLAQAQSAQSALIKQGFANANAANISFTDAAGVTDTYQADPTSVADLNNCLSAFRAAAAVPSGFYWRSATNNNNAFTYADLVNLAAALANRGFANFAQLQTLKANVMAATTVSDVQAVVW